MTIKYLQDLLKELIEKGDLNENDEIMIVGSGDKLSGHLSGVVFPRTQFKKDQDSKGLFCIGFLDRKTNDPITFDKMDG